MAAPPINVTHLFKPLDDKLIDLLSSLTPGEWSKPTIAKLWNVKDVAAHLLDGNIRVLSMSRDRYFGITPVNDDILGFLNTINADWVKAMKRMSPEVLTWLLQIIGKPVSEHYASIDPFSKALFPVAWAGENESLSWMHIAREYTEKFIHQQQIRDAVGKQGILTREFFFPFIHTFMQALPYTYRNAKAVTGTIVQVVVNTEAGGEWNIIKSEDGWMFTDLAEADASVEMDPDTAWKLFSKGITPAEAVNKVQFKGKIDLASTALSMISVMA